MGRIIKRYENRKLYDTEARKYISLEEISKLVRQGVDVQVIDRGTESDITTQTLTQIIFEEGKNGQNPFSKEILHDVIRWSNRFFDGSLQQVRQGIDQIVPDSISRLFGHQDTEELDSLKEKVQSLEKLIIKLVDQQNDIKPSK